MKKRYTIVSAKEVITRNGGKVGADTIKCSLPGLKTLGAIDYLVNHCGYNWKRAA